MSDIKAGAEVRDQAADDSILNTEPAVVRGAVIAAVGAIGTILVVFGVLDESQKEALTENAVTIVIAILAILPILQALWTRIAVYSPRSAARIAVTNAAAGDAAVKRGVAGGAVPTLAPPP